MHLMTIEALLARAQRAEEMNLVGSGLHSQVFAFAEGGETLLLELR